MTCPQSCQDKHSRTTLAIKELKLTAYGSEGRGGLVVDVEHNKGCIKALDKNKASTDDIKEVGAEVEKKLSRKGFVITTIAVLAIVVTFVLYGMETSAERRDCIAENKTAIAEVKKDTDGCMKRLDKIEDIVADINKNISDIKLKMVDPKKLLDDIRKIVKEK